jgi:hypothetical protein
VADLDAIIDELELISGEYHASEVTEENLVWWLTRSRELAAQATGMLGREAAAFRALLDVLEVRCGYALDDYLRMKVAANTPHETEEERSEVTELVTQARQSAADAMGVIIGIPEARAMAEPFGGNDPLGPTVP